jgi:site-specific DNA recombinase
MGLEANREAITTPIRAALYARVSTDKQREEATIESQVFELKRQIVSAQRVLVKEYIDDGFSGKYLDRPAMDELRRDAKKDVFDAIYFLCADRIARHKIDQDIIVGELLKKKKRIVISGKDYEENPDNRLALDVLGVVAEFERAKIAERMRRGRLHRLRQGQIASNGHCIFGYDYVRRTEERPAALVVNDQEAAVVRWVFETCAAGGSIRGIARSLEARNVPTKLGKDLWRPEQIRSMLKNHAYAGVRYFNRMEEEKSSDRKRGKLTYRDRSEWIGVKVPEVVNAELFDLVQERLAKNIGRYCQPATHYLLSGLVECGECGAAVTSYRRYLKKELVTGTQRVYHKSAYKCTWRFRQMNHAPGRIERCYNPEIATHMLEGIVLDLIHEVVCDPARLLESIVRPKRVELGQKGVPQRLAGVAAHIVAIEDERRRLIELYASDRMKASEYIDANRALDWKLARLKRERADLSEGIHPHRRDARLESSARQFSDRARAGLDASTDLATRQQFLAEHVERVIYWQEKVEIVGSITVPNESPVTPDEKVPFRVERKIDRRALRAKPRAPLPGDGRFRQWNPRVAAAVAAHPVS